MRDVTAPFAIRMLVVGVGLVAFAVSLPPNPQTDLTFYYSTDAAAVLEPLIQQFNQEYEGRIHVIGEVKNSGDAVHAMVDEGATPDLWMPAASMWGSLLNERLGGNAIAPEDSPSFFWSPLVFAAWPDKTGNLPYIDWESIAKRADTVDPARFSLGHTKPTRSTSGLYALMSEFEASAAASAADPLTTKDVQDQSVMAGVKAMEDTVIHYGDIGRDFCPLLETQGSDYVTTVYLQETVYLTCRLEQTKDPWQATYPTEGTFAADYPLYVLQGPWTAEASEFVRWLGDAIQDDKILDAFLRPGDASTLGGPAPADPRKEENPPSTVKVLDDPITSDGPTLAAIQDAWPAVRKQANVLFVLDSSFYMADVSGQAHELVCDLSAAIASPPEDERADHIGLISYAKRTKEIRQLSSGGWKGDCQKRLQKVPVGSSPAGLPSAIRDAVQEVRAQKGETIDTVIVVSYGATDGVSEQEQDQLCHYLHHQSAQIITVSFAESRALERLSYCSGAPAFKVWESYTDDNGMEELADDLSELL